MNYHMEVEKYVTYSFHVVYYLMCKGIWKIFA